jgi:glycosyltransferase involved in cell wall biosynthesis
MSNLSLSVFIPSYNQGKFIGRTIDSILRDGVACQIIVMDGGSTDNTAEVVSRYGDKVVFISERDAGQSDALNKALKLAKGEWIGWQNSDDYYEPGALLKFEKCISLDIERKCVGDVYFGHATISDVNDFVGFVKYYTPFSIDDLIVNGFNITNQSAIFRKSFVDKIGGWDKTLHFCMDLDFFIRLYLAGANFRLINSVLGSFRVHGEAKSSNMHETRIREWGIIIPRYFPFINVSDVVTRRKKERLYWLLRRLYYLSRQGLIFDYTKNRIAASRRGESLGHPATNCH